MIKCSILRSLLQRKLFLWSKKMFRRGKYKPNIKPGLARPEGKSGSRSFSSQNSQEVPKTETSGRNHSEAHREKQVVNKVKGQDGDHLPISDSSGESLVLCTSKSSSQNKEKQDIIRLEKIKTPLEIDVNQTESKTDENKVYLVQNTDPDISKKTVNISVDIQAIDVQSSKQINKELCHERDLADKTLNDQVSSESTTETLFGTNEKKDDAPVVLIEDTAHKGNNEKALPGKNQLKDPVFPLADHKPKSLLSTTNTNDGDGGAEKDIIISPSTEDNCHVLESSATKTDVVDDNMAGTSADPVKLPLSEEFCNTHDEIDDAVENKKPHVSNKAEKEKVKKKKEKNNKKQEKNTDKKPKTRKKLVQNDNETAGTDQQGVKRKRSSKVSEKQSTKTCTSLTKNGKKIKSENKLIKGANAAQKNITEKTQDSTSAEKPKKKDYVHVKKPKLTGPIDETKMTMADLVFHKMEPDSPKEKKPWKNNSNDTRKHGQILPSKPVEEPGPSEHAPQITPVDEEESVFAPQIMLSADGSVVINESSLYIDQSEKDDQIREVVYEDENTNFNPYNRKKGSRSRWSLSRTLKFYNALSQVGTDFTLMLSIFPDETRARLKRKFKTEEKLNGDLVDKALANRLPLNFANLLDPENEESDDVT